MASAAVDHWDFAMIYDRDWNDGQTLDFSANLRMKHNKSISTAIKMNHLDAALKTLQKPMQIQQ